MKPWRRCVLARALANHLPDHEFLITTNTITGLGVIQAAMADQPGLPVSHVMQPLDHPDFVDQFLGQLAPRCRHFHGIRFLAKSYSAIQTIWHSSDFCVIAIIK